MAFEDAWKIAMQIADALEYAYDKGVIHRDLKSANVKVTPDDVAKPLDFGLAKAFSETQDAGHHGSGEFAYDHAWRDGGRGRPRHGGVHLARTGQGQAGGQGSRHLVLGLALYDLLTGERLFKGSDTADTLAQVLTKEPPLERVPPQV
jgi:serine/threonine protein kinase